MKSSASSRAACANVIRASKSGFSARHAFGIAVLTCLAACSGSPTQPPPPAPPGGATATAGFALAVGLNAVDPAHYGGWSGNLTGCEPDAKDMRDIATSAGLQTKTLLTQQATRAATLGEISAAAARLHANDLFVLSYSGHGGQIPDLNGDETVDGMDETWCLFDGELIDDELYAALGAFEPGVRVLVFSDSCHSGTMLRAKDFDTTTPERDLELKSGWSKDSKPTAVRAMATSAPAIVMRAMPPDVALDTYRRNKAFYDRIGKQVSRDARANVKCQALLISGCMDDQLSADMGNNGLFTLELKQVWNHGAFSGGHPAFQQAIRAAVLQNNSSQAPAYFTVGNPISGYEAQRPYTLKAP